MNILFYVHFYAPEVGAASLRAQYFVKALEESGNHVKVITPIPNYPAGKHYEGFPAQGFKKQKRNGVTYLPIFAPRKQSLIIRGISYISYFVTSLFYSVFVKFKYDLIITSSPPMSTAFAAVLLSKIKRKPLVVDIRDLWPDIGIELKIIKNQFLIKLLRSIDRFILSNSKRIIVPLDNFRSRLLRKNSSLNIATISNGADTSLFKPIDSPDERTKIRQEYKLPINKKIFIYFGFFNFGMNDVDLLADAIKKLDDQKEKVHFLFIGGGAKKESFVAEINSHVNFTFFEPMDIKEIAEILPACDLSLIPLKKIEGNTGGFIPVKCLESWAAGLPVLLASSGDQEIEEIFNTSEGGFISPAGDSDSLANLMIKLINEDTLSNMGEFAREFVTQNFDRKKQSEKLIKIVEEIEKT